MVEYVYALHDFVPENEDEVSFSAGERIEVVEKDDLYGDGWWQGRNLLGKVGLFPVSYTTPAAPTTDVVTSSTLPENEDPDSASAVLGQKTLLNTLPEESESGSPRPDTGLSSNANGNTNIIAPVPKAAPAQFLNGNHHDFHDADNDDDANAHAPTTLAGGDEVMKATLTDVQKAIEQLGRNRSDNDDGGRSFSFASTRDDRDTDTDIDLSDLDVSGVAGGVDDVEGWHKGARLKLAEKARRAVEEAEKLEALMNGLSAGERRVVAPPIEVEMSDESEDEGDREFTTRSSGFQGIPEEDENELEDGALSRGKYGTAAGTPVPPPVQANGDAGVLVTLPPRDEMQPETATAERSSFPASSPLVVESESPKPRSSARLSASSVPTHDVAKASSPVPMLLSERARTSTPLQYSTSPTTPPPPVVPASSSPPLPRALSPQVVQAKHTSIASAASGGSYRSSLQIPPPSPEPTQPLPPIPGPTSVPVFSVQPTNSNMTATTVRTAVTTATTIMPSPVSQSESHASSGAAVVQGQVTPQMEEKKKETHPSEWTLEEVIEWLKSKGFDQDVCDKFIEQEITGDVLLELDANLLKTEIGIMAFGKRVRISNAIAELRRPPSISYSDHMIPQGGGGGGGGSVEVSNIHTPITPQSQVHSRAQSQSHSHHSFSGSIIAAGGAPGHQYTQSIQSSLGSPLGFTSGGGLNGFVSTNGNGGGGGGVGFTGVPMPLVESPSQDIVNVSKSDGVGLGISDSYGYLKPRPMHLALSPSDGALKDSVTSLTISHKTGTTIIGTGEDEHELEDRGHMSDGDVTAPATSSMRRRLFGRSHDSTSSFRHSKDVSPTATASPSLQSIPDKYYAKDAGGTGKEKEKAKEKEKEKERDRAGSVGSGGASEKQHKRGKRSIDGGKSGGGGERLSIFGGTFGGSLGKGRKPPPAATTEEMQERSTSMFASLPRLGSSSTRKSSSTHRATPTENKEFNGGGDMSPKNKGRERETLLRKRTSSSGASGVGVVAVAAPAVGTGEGTGLVMPGKSILEQIGEPDHVGWMRKRGDRYNSWKSRYFVLKGPHMYCLRSDSKAETKIKGYIHVIGYKVSVDENLDPGRYGFRIDHDHDKTHYFSSDEKAVVRDFMKAIMKATIDRDYSKPVVSSCNIPTIPLTVAQAMNPAPRPPSPTARAATQKALRRENPNQLSTRDAQILMGLSSSSGGSAGVDGKDGRVRLDSFFANQDIGTGSSAIPAASVAAKLGTINTGPAPPRPSREMRRTTSVRSSGTYQTTMTTASEEALIEWANSHLPPRLQITDSTESLCSGLALLRIAEAIKGKAASPPVPDSAFPVDMNDDKLDGLFRLFDFLLDNDVKMGNVSINDVRQGKRDKVVQLMKALKAWEDRKRAIAQSFGKAGVQAGGFVAF